MPEKAFPSQSGLIYPCLAAPLYLYLGGCESISPALVGSEASAWGAPAPPSCPGPGSSGVSLVPACSPFTAPFTLEPEASCGATSAGYTVPAMGTAWTLTPRGVLLSGGRLQLPVEGTLPAGSVVSHSGSPGPISSTAPFCRTVLPSERSLRSCFSTGARPLVSAGGTLVLGGGRTPSPSHAQTGLCEAACWACPAPGVVLCGRRAGGKALT